MLEPLERVEDALFQKSRNMPPPWGSVLRLLRYPAALIRDWVGGEISIRAMSLAYTTLLSLVPLMVFSFAILKGLGARGDLRFLLGQFFRPMGAAADQLTESVLQFVVNMRGELLGTIGLAFLVYTVITTIQKVEGSFNFVWRVARPRSLARRFTEYLSVMIVGPILLAVALGLLGSAEHSALVRDIVQVAPLGAVVAFLGQIAPYAIVAAVFSFMYAFIPNTRVSLSAAFIGGIAAGIIWALVGKLFTAFLVFSSHMVAIYTGFAIVLTTLIWVYMSWLILLFGAQLAFYVQFPQYLPYGLDAVELTASDRERAALSAMVLIGRDYESGKPCWNGARVAAELDIPGIALAPVLARLERAGLIVATEKEQFVPGRETDKMRLADILDAVRTVEVARLKISVRAVEAASRVMEEVEAAARGRLGTSTLKELIAAATLPRRSSPAP
ncbi:MAG TPA: YhjD/YihY/BrkB family envelope integrity protein [Steroidobacteraceae bacterium]|nr:YhjD/YihY/BrkB family envelope integrity protein [Steroidobacteraceae bacterium]